MIGVFNRDMKYYDCLCFISLEILCLLIFVTLVNQITFNDQFKQKTRKLKIVQLLFLETVHIDNPLKKI